MPTWKEKFTFILVPHSSGKRSYTLSVRWITVAFLLFFGLALAAVTFLFAGIGAVTNPYRINSKFASYEQEIERLREENRQYKKQQRHARALGEKVEKISEEQQALAKFTGLDYLKSKVQENASGEFKTGNISGYLSAVQKQKKKLEKVKKFVKHRTKVLENSPMMWPIDGWISSGYGYRQDPMGGRGRSFHEGLDIAAWAGSPVRSTAEGEVIFSGRKSGYGRTIVLEHGFGFKTLYGHLGERVVDSGEKVKKGQMIGRVGSSGLATGSHLHYEIKVNKKTVNPEPYLVEAYSRYQNSEDQEE